MNRPPWSGGPVPHAGNQLLFRFGDACLAMCTRCSEPVRERDSRQQLQRAVRSAQPFLTPATYARRR